MRFFQYFHAYGGQIAITWLQKKSHGNLRLNQIAKYPPRHRNGNRTRSAKKPWQGKEEKETKMNAVEKPIFYTALKLPTPMTFSITCFDIIFGDQQGGPLSTA